MPKKISEKNVLAVLETLNGRKRNPTIDDGDSQCVYTHEKNPDRHCIAGEILIGLGWGRRVPSASDEANSWPIDMVLMNTFSASEKKKIEPDGLGTLCELQSLADEDRPTWAQVRKDFYEQREQEHNGG